MNHAFATTHQTFAAFLFSHLNGSSRARASLSCSKFVKISPRGSGARRLRAPRKKHALLRAPRESTRGSTLGYLSQVASVDGHVGHRGGLR